MCKYDPYETERIAWQFDESRRSRSDWQKDFDVRSFATLAGEFYFPIVPDIIAEPLLKCSIHPNFTNPELHRRYGFCVEHRNFVVFIYSEAEWNKAFPPFIYYADR